MIIYMFFTVTNEDEDKKSRTIIADIKLLLI